MSKEKVKYNIEYEEAPSGNVTFYNYKEPLMKFEEGYGFVGALVFDSETDKIQCHLCGDWFESLPHHLAREHNIKAAAYKDMVGLRQSTALISESLRAKLIANGLQKRIRNLKNQKGVVRSKEVKERIAMTLKQNRLESQNEKGTCPLQLIARLKSKFIELGRLPSEKIDEGCGFLRTVRQVYGSMEQACNIAGIPYRKPGQTMTHGNLKYTRDKCLEFIENFVAAHDRVPKYSDAGGGLWMAIDRYGKDELFKEAILKNGEYRKVNGFRIKWSKEDLIRIWRNFEKTYGRRPAPSDCRRGLLPATGNYYYHFKNWKNIVKESELVETSQA